MPLGLDHEEIGSYLTTMYCAPSMDGVKLLVDSTGIGFPVIQTFKRCGLKPVGVTITGTMEDVEVEHAKWHVGKGLLVSCMSSLVGAGGLLVSEDSDESRALLSEMGDFRMVSSENTGRVLFNARAGKHDDLVLAVAQGVWYASRQINLGSTGTFSVGHGGLSLKWDSK